MNLDRIIGNRAHIGRNIYTSGSRTGYALDSAYVNHTSGDAVAIRYICGSTDSIEEVYFYADAFADLANITLVAYVYNYNATSTRTGATLLATSTATTLPSGDDMWIKFTFGTPYDPAIGEILWVVIANTSGDPVNDYPNILTSTTYGLLENTMAGQGWSQMVPYTTTGGFASAGTAAVETPFIIKQGSVYYGTPWTQLNTAYYTNNTLERGLRVTCTEDCTVVGAQFIGASAYDKFRITLAATIPGAAVGAGEMEYDLDSTYPLDTHGGVIFSTPFTLLGGTAYNVTFTYAANSQLPYVAEIQDYASYSTVFDTLRAYDTMSCPWGIISDGGGTPAWVENKAICPNIQLIISDFPAQAAGGGLLTHPGMSGGMRG